ncbi:MAG: complex I subunit 1 family protein, partial [Gemmataceae bacterium]
VGGFHTEYSGMKFALFFLGEYTHMIVTSLIVVAVFFGGWLLPGVTTPGWFGWGDAILKLCIYCGKMILFVMFYMFIRWTLPRFRFDQLMDLSWKVLMPLGLENVVILTLFVYFGLNKWWLPLLSLLTLVIAAALALQKPRPNTRAKIPWRGHPVTGQGATVLR